MLVHLHTKEIKEQWDFCGRWECHESGVQINLLVSNERVNCNANERVIQRLHNHHYVLCLSCFVILLFFINGGIFIAKQKYFL